MPPPFNLHNRRMTCTQTAPGGVINHDTHFTFTQTGNRVEAHYAGGRVLSGHLIGLITGDQLEFRYCQLHTTPDASHGELAGGHSLCELHTDDQGRVSIIERYTWANGESGENIIAES